MTGGASKTESDAANVFNICSGMPAHVLYRKIQSLKSGDFFGS